MGGRADIKDERLFRFEFPEQPGALGRFLTALDGGFNISLFHYRDQGGDQARVLVGLQVPCNETLQFQEFLNRLGYSFVEETSNAAYHDFLG